MPPLAMLPRDGVARLLVQRVSLLYRELGLTTQSGCCVGLGFN
jgi:hypothetical protein